MTAEAAKRELNAALHSQWPKARAADDLPFPDFWRKTGAWLAFHAPHVGDGLMRQLITDAIAECIRAEKDGKEPKAPEVSEKVRAIWAEVETQGEKPARPATHFAAPFSGPTPGALRRTRKLMMQGELL